MKSISIKELTQKDSGLVEKSIKDRQAEYDYLAQSCNFLLTNKMMGRILTLIDASLSESKQTDSLKDIIRQEIYSIDTDIWRKLNEVFDTKGVLEVARTK